MAKKSILSGFMNTDVKQLSFDNQIQNIHYTKIHQSEKNRSLRRIDELAEDIAEDGLDDNLVVRKLEQDFELIAGHRRYNAILHNIEHGDMTYEYIPCKVVILSELDARKRLILNNYQNDPLTSSEKLDAIEELRDIYRTKKIAGEKIPGRIQYIIAEEMELGKSQVANYEKILNNAVPEVRELIRNEEMTIETAVDVAGLEPEEQEQFIKHSEDYTKHDLEEFKEERKETQLAFDENEEIIEEELTETAPYYDEIEDEEEESEELEEKLEMLSKTNAHETIEDIVSSIVNQIDNLDEKINHVEFREEHAQLDNVKLELDKLMARLGLECEECL